MRARSARPHVAPGVRVYAVGDIHGRRDLLVTLLARIERDASRRADGREIRLVFLGDYIDRGDESAAVIDLLLTLAQTCAHRVSFLEGNHEAALAGFLADPVGGRAWLSHGGWQTLASYGVRPPPARAEDGHLIETRDRLRAALGPHLRFLDLLKPSVRSGQVIFVHAGVNPTLPVPDADRHACLWGHPASLSDDPVPGHRIVHGHFEQPDPVSRRGRIGIDTGAYHTGRLTAVRLDQHEAFLSTLP